MKSRILVVDNDADMVALLRRQPLQGAPSLRAAHRVLEGLDKAWSPRALASYVDTTPEGVAARPGVPRDRGDLAR